MFKFKVTTTILDRPNPHRRRPPVETDSTALGERAEAAWRRGEALAEQGDFQGALIWLARAHRLAPSDQNLLFSLAMAELSAGKATAAAGHFATIARQHGVRESWSGLAAASLRCGDIGGAVEAIGAALSRNMADAGLLSLVVRVAAQARLPGWCAFVGPGKVRVGAACGPVELRLDGRIVQTASPGAEHLQLPSEWQQSAELVVSQNGGNLLGSPISLAAILRLEGFAERTKAGVEGWAWHPSAPELDPDILLLDEAGVELASVSATDITGSVQGTSPLARPRSFGFRVPASATVRVTSRSGRDLPGSPLPAAGRRQLPLPGSGVAAPDNIPCARRPITIVIPVYRGIETTRACIASVLGSLPPAARILAVNDASPEPAVVAALQDLAQAGRIDLVASCAADPARNLGFPSAVNAGLAAASGRDVVLLNSDTLVAGDWLTMLADAAYSAADIGTATPFSNDATILSYPQAAAPNRFPSPSETRTLAAQAAQANGGLIVEIPTAHGFCMFIRHDCLASTGGFEEAIFAQGYGEENDFSERARDLGWRHVGVPGAFVAHEGGVSFGAGRTHLLMRNLGILAALHPGYHPRIATFMASDALFPSRRRLDEVRWRSGRQAGAVLLITHGGAGGTKRIVAGRGAEIRQAGLRPIVLSASDGLCCVGEEEGGFPNLRYHLPGELPALLALLGDDKPVAAELHHLLGHDHSITALFAAFKIPYDVWVHDYSWLCPRISLVMGEGRYCGEPPAPVCESCVRQWGRAIEDPVSPTLLRTRSAADFAAARSIRVPSDDVARRLRRHFPRVRPDVTPWQAHPPFQAPSVHARTGRLVVATVGGIGVEKGFDVLLACALDAAARKLPVDFVIVGYSIDDDSLEATGHVRITGPFRQDEAGALIAAQGAQMAFLPSIWPETWCYALSDIWEAGLSAAVFDIGAPADRVRQCGRGWVLPLGLPAPSINDVLLRFANA